MAAQGSRRSPAKPATPAGKALSARHLRENVAYNKQHSDDHLKQAAADKKALAALTKQTKKTSKNDLKRAKKS